MCLSRTTGYAIQALGCLNDPACFIHQIGALAKAAGVPKPYLAKVVAALSRKGLLFTKRGYHGGLSLARRAEEISLLEIVEAVEGEHWLSECLIGFSECAKHLSCPTQPFWKRVRREIIEELRRTSLAQVLAAQNGVSKGRPARESNALRGQPKPASVNQSGRISPS